MDGKTIANKYDCFNNLIEMILKICEKTKPQGGAFFLLHETQEKNTILPKIF